MNPTIQFMKQQGIKVSLPLLLLATACGEGTPSASLSPVSLDAESSAATPEVIADTSGFEAPATPELPSPATTPTSATAPTAGSGVVATAVPAASVPEPTTLAGLAVAALGLGAIKRKSAA